jgi:hypothetical protein
MYMETTEILEQVIISIEAWNDFDKIGEEIRAMEETIRYKTIIDIDPVMEALLEMIEDYPDDYDLGRVIRSIYIPIKVILNDNTTNP